MPSQQPQSPCSHLSRHRACDHDGSISPPARFRIDAFFNGLLEGRKHGRPPYYRDSSSRLPKRCRRSRRSVLGSRFSCFIDEALLFGGKRGDGLLEILQTHLSCFFVELHERLSAPQHLVKTAEDDSILGGAVRLPGLVEGEVADIDRGIASVDPIDVWNAEDPVATGGPSGRHLAIGDGDAAS